MKILDELWKNQFEFSPLEMLLGTSRSMYSNYFQSDIFYYLLLIQSIIIKNTINKEKPTIFWKWKSLKSFNKNRISTECCGFPKIQFPFRYSLHLRLFLSHITSLSETDDSLTLKTEHFHPHPRYLLRKIDPSPTQNDSFTFALIGSKPLGNINLG